MVETDFGFHIIRVDAVRGGETKTFDAVRAQIENEVKDQLAKTRYAEAAEQFTNLVYEQSDTLQPAADKLKLAVQTQHRASHAGAGRKRGARQSPSSWTRCLRRKR